MKIKLPLFGWIHLECRVKVRLHGKNQSTTEVIPGCYAIPGGRFASHDQIVAWAAERDVEVAV